MATVTVCQQEQVMPVCHLIMILVSWGWSHSSRRQMGCKQAETEMKSLFLHTKNSFYQTVLLKTYLHSAFECNVKCQKNNVSNVLVFLDEDRRIWRIDP